LPVKDASIITNICDDSLGGYTAIDARKFAENFVKRRRLDSKGGASEWASLDNIVSPVLPKEKKDEWHTQKGTSRNASVSGSASDLKGFANENKFAQVLGKKKKNKK
jgi:hypothetical protein